MTKIKCCGLMRNADIDMANRLHPDYIGFVFAKKSRRYIEMDTAKALKSRLDQNIRAVGVFVDADMDEITALVNAGIIEMIQLHGSEDVNYLKRLQEHVDVPIIKAVQIRTKEDTKGLESIPADLLLLDAGAGDGKAFDWDLLEDIRQPYFLAGGLNPENVGDAVALLHPYGVDVSTGIETDGYKDEAKMRAFINAARSEK